MIQREMQIGRSWSDLSSYLLFFFYTCIIVRPSYRSFFHRIQHGVTWFSSQIMQSMIFVRKFNKLMERAKIWQPSSGDRIVVSPTTLTGYIVPVINCHDVVQRLVWKLTFFSQFSRRFRWEVHVTSIKLLCTSKPEQPLIWHC